MNQPTDPHEARAAAAWQNTRALDQQATQILDDPDEYLAGARKELGRRVGSGAWELFVVCEPAEALHQQFSLHAPDFVTVHDVGTQSSQSLLNSLAGFGGKPGRLVVRRQGYGTALATLSFVEFEGTYPNPPLRIYSTAVDADSAQRAQIARVLLAYSRLGIVMVGDLPPHALASGLRPLHDAILTGPWVNRNLLMLPLAPSGALASQASQLVLGTGIAVATTPTVSKPEDAWPFIAGTWNRLRAQLGAQGAGLVELAAAGLPRAAAAAVTSPPPRPAPLPMQPMPELPRPAAAAPPQQRSPFAAYVEQIARLPGVTACCTFDAQSQRTLAHAGKRPGPATLTSQAAMLYATLGDSARALGLAEPGAPAPEATIALGTHVLLLRTIPRQPGIVAATVVQRAGSDLVQIQAQMLRLAATLEAPAG